MTNRTTAPDRTAILVQQMTEQMIRLAQTLSQWVQAEAHPLQAIETQVVRVLHDLGAVLLNALVPLAAPARPAPDVPCACGQVRPDRALCAHAPGDRDHPPGTPHV